MTAEELYGRIGGDYEEAKTRLMNDQLISRFIVKFLEDGTYGQLVEAWDAGDEEGIFRASHTLKGVCGNLSLTKLFKVSSEITECYRPGNEDRKAAADLPAMMADLKEAYQLAVSEIQAFAQQ